jgi:hypothetical protein
VKAADDAAAEIRGTRILGDATGYRFGGHGRLVCWGVANAIRESLSAPRTNSLKNDGSLPGGRHRRAVPNTSQGRLKATLAQPSVISTAARP